ncbi:J domain-containing protein [Sphingomonas sp. NBWT7]|uniref:J domain-containing protein n=1 Tax=Sphingomonas sp. NBWT7 TaxID=2596913 RepID=UPI0016274C50|nr:J domain-containing protein [Sphingomonas sp. NBWT7]QNE32679.1 J domain-containing protein [Sphingomonas sp. NBWT7]
MIWKLLIAMLVAYAGWKLWKDALGSGKRAVRSGPTVDPADAIAARRLLGLDASADERGIRDAHRRLMSEAHPDRGGSPERARALNAARDLLLRRG